MAARLRRTLTTSTAGVPLPAARKPLRSKRKPSAITVSALSVLFIIYIVRQTATNFNSRRLLPRYDQGRESFLTSEEQRLAEPFQSLLSDPPRDEGLLALQLTSYLAPGAHSSPAQKKLVALVELRNVADALPVFLSALAPLIDGVVVLDDRSSDATRAMLLRRLPFSADVEVLITKEGGSDAWVREELRDRQILLRFGRRVGGTHFVLPDYDEFFSANCVADGYLRKKILALPPGHSISIPWVEAWKSTRLHRVLPDDPDMNFLTRRQTIVFADDRNVQYDTASSIARSLDTDSSISNATIHVLRCPRTLCPQPPRYSGPEYASSSSYPVTVKHLAHCRVVELRFLSMSNILIKSAWYEALGRVMGADDKITRGKMHDIILNDRSSETRGVTALATIDPSWLPEGVSLDASAYSRVEMWRVHELLRWRSMHGAARFAGLPAIELINFAGLRIAADRVDREAKNHLDLVPRVARSRSTFVMAVDSLHAPYSVGALAGMLGAMGGVDINLGANNDVSSFLLACTASEDLARDIDESCRQRLARRVHNSMQKSLSGLAYWSVDMTEEVTAMNFFAILIDDMAYLDIVFLAASSSFGSKADGMRLLRESGLKNAVSFGGSVRYMEVHVDSLGSLSVLSVLRERLIVPPACGSEDVQSGAGQDKLLEFAEKRHTVMSTLGKKGLRAGSGNNNAVPPVAQLVFSLNVGRSGSKYVSRLLGSTGAAGLISLHEPRCPNNACSGGGAMRMQDVKLANSYEMRRTLKIGMIQHSIAQVQSARVTAILSSCDKVQSRVGTREVLEADWRGGGCWTRYRVADIVYAETNPNFKSWFYDVVLDTYPRRGYALNVLVLRKYMAAAARSLHATGFFSQRDGHSWMETAGCANCPLTAPSNWEIADALDLITSYLVNAEMVTRRIMRKYAQNEQIWFLERRSEDVYGAVGALELLRDLGLSASTATVKLAGQRVDKYDSGRREATVKLDECERRVTAFLRRCNEGGLHVPLDMEQLQRVVGFDYGR
jgi:hypothetical protein